ncbi:MAG: hypothetical protein ACRD5E_04550 [Nitrososphaeraceae archaeon]
MTFHYFTLYPTLNGMSKQTTLAKKVDYELLEEILENIKVAVEDQKHNFQKTMSKQQKHKDLKQPEIWSLAKEMLIAHVSLRTLYRWAHEYLQPEAFMESKQKAALARQVTHSISVSADNWQQDLKQQIEEPKVCYDESCVKGYEFQKVREGQYSYAFLQKLCIWLDETLELKSRGK